MLSKASQEFLEETANNLKKLWVGKICVVIDTRDSQRLYNINGNLIIPPHHYIKMATKDPTECDTFGYVDGKMVRPDQKPQKIGDWYFGDRSKNGSININSIVFVVDIVRAVGGGYSSLPYWAAIILYKEKNWIINLASLAIEDER